MNNRPASFIKNRIIENIRPWESIRHAFFHDDTVAPVTLGDYLAYSGIVSAVLLVVQIITGLLLLFYYSPHPMKAFESVVFIQNEAPNGFLFVTLHAINAKLIVLMLFIHMFRIMYVSAHRGPRSHQWYTGSALLTLMLITGFSGYLLPWSQQSFWACVIGTEAMRTIPLIGDGVAWLLKGGKEVSGTTLAIFYGFHVILLPISIVILIWFHLKRVWETGVSAPPDMIARIEKESCIGCGLCERICPFEAIAMDTPYGKKKACVDQNQCNGCRACLGKCPTASIGLFSGETPMKREPLFPHGVLNRAVASLVTLIILFAAVFFFHGLLMETRTPADPLVTPDRIKPDWYFMGPYQLLKVMPSEFMGLLTLAAVFLLMVFLPKLDRSGPRSPEKRPVYIFLVKTAILSFIFFTLWGFIS